MIAAAIEFDMAFRALTDHQPLRWQRRLFDLLRRGEIPQVCDLPTGLGKTSVIPIWTIALAWQAQNGPIVLPRRLVYIVNRRTVVDQATDVVQRMRERLRAPDDPRWSGHADALCALAGALKRLASTEELCLAVSTLRGELADNEEWKADPTRPAIIVGTIDMIGSKLLFSGYGDGRYWRAQHAGLIGQDALIVHDEAHLTPAFGDLLRSLAEIQERAREPRPVRIMELTATSRRAPVPILERASQREQYQVHALTSRQRSSMSLELEPEDEEEPFVRERLDATKRLYLHPVSGNAQEALEKVVALSVQHEQARAKVLIYVRSPEHAQKVIRLLEKELGKQGRDRSRLLTGTVRGYERDWMVREDRVYRAFLDSHEPVEQTLYLVSTSAGEVGIDLDADHLVCDLATLDAMVQRLGRVNRRGGPGRVARVDVVAHTTGDGMQDGHPNAVEEAIKETRAILTEWAEQAGGVLDVGPRKLRALLLGLGPDRREKAFAPRSAAPPLTDIFLDGWSLTTITGPMPGRAAVAAYLHGLEAQEPPETYVAWRKEVKLLGEADVAPEAVRDWFQACRVEARERLRDRTDRVQQTLQDVLNAHRKQNGDERRDFPVVLLDERGEAELTHLSNIVKKGFNLAYRTIVLPVEAGGLDEWGTLDPSHLVDATDVAEEVAPGSRGQPRQRWLETDAGDGRRFEHLLTREVAEALPQGLKERERVVLREASEETGIGGRELVLLAEPMQSALDHAETARVRQPLAFHLEVITERMKRIAQALGLDGELGDALAQAAAWHDRGKDRPVWQWYACNPDAAVPLAKSTRYLHARLLGGYRHEFGSLLEAEGGEELRRHPERDLILHLIAAHHGWARPHFERNAWDNSRTTAENEAAATEALRRFARLQQRFGRWGLAWLESLVRCADIAASKPDVQPTSEPPQGEGTHR